MSMQDYQIQKVIGEGAYGRAILCKEKKSGVQVVIKEITLSNLSAQEQNEARKETKILASLHHPNIIGYRGSFLQNSILYIVMEYADNGDLYEQIKNAHGSRFSEEQILDWFVQICLALKHIHDRKILHRDIKCQNIFLMKNGMIKMGDFGIAKVLDHTSQYSKTAIGTPYYLSPEICQGKLYNAKSDIWSLGCVLYELCTLKHAFDSNCMNGLIMKILRAKQSPIHYGYSQDLRTLLDKLLQKDPNKRPSINQILKYKFIHERIGSLLSQTLQKIEFSHTVFHGVRGGETPKDIERKELPAISEAPSNNNQKIAKNDVNDHASNQPKARVEKAVPNQKPVQSARQQNPKPVQSRPQSSNNQKKAPYKPKELPHQMAKDELAAQKHAAAVELHKKEKEARARREEEARQQEELEAQKREEIYAKKRESAAERKAKMEALQREERERQKKYQNLEAPFKKAMGGMKKPQSANSKNSTDSDGEYKNDQVKRPPPSLDAPKVVARPGKVKDREEEINNLREMIKRKRAEQRRLEREQQNQSDNPPEPKPEIKQEPKPESKPEIKQEPKPELKPVPKQEPKPVPKSEPKPEPKQEIKQQIKQENKPEIKKANIKSEVPQKPERTEKKESVKKSEVKVNQEDENEDFGEEEEVKRAPIRVKPMVIPQNFAKQGKEAPDDDSDRKQPGKKLNDLIPMDLSDDSDDDETDDDMLSLAAIAKNIFENPPDEEEDEEIETHQSIPSHFYFAGKELILPCVTDKDSMNFRIEALRQFIEKNLGFDTFSRVYRFLSDETDQLDDAQIDMKMKQLLIGETQMSFYPLIQQLIVCEDGISE